MEDNVGTIVISTKINTKGLEKGLNEVKRKSKQLEDKPVKITYGDKPEFAGVAGERWKEVEAGSEKTFREWQNIQNALPTEKYETLLNFQEELNNDTQEQKELLVETNKRIGDMSKNFGEIGNKIGGLTKKIIRWGLAFIGIRTAISLITRSFSTLSQYNDELGNKIQQMRLVLAVALEPIINWIVTLLQQVLTLVNQIYSAITGISLFGRASELWSKKMAKNMSSSAGSAKEIKKQLAGFDEMNVIQDTSSGGGGGAGGSAMQPFDLEEMEPPKWLQWILDNGPSIIGVIAGIATALGLIKLGLDPITSGGIGLIVAGLVTSILSLLKYLNDPSWGNFGDIIIGIGIAITGLGILVGGLPVIIVGAILAIVGVIVKYWEDIKAFLENILKWIRDKGDNLYINGHNVIEKFAGFFMQMFGDLFNWFIKTLDNLFKTWRSKFDGIIMFFKGIFTGNWKQAWEGIGQIASAYINNILGLFQNTLNLILGYFSRIGSAVGGVIGGSFKNVINAVLDWVQNKINAFIRAMNKVINKVNGIPGIKITRLSEVSLPRMKTGAIINQPGRGVPVGVGGEAGKEGILPLTDRQAMAELGREIGKWITINANITNTMNGRVISRELQKINNENDFAFNS